MTQHEKMFALVEQWERSSETKAEFARQHKISPQTFHYWWRRYRDQQPKRTAPTFIELPTVELTHLGSTHRGSREPRLRVEFADGMSISIY